MESPASELRETGISVVGDVRWGAHLCHFYETKEDLLDILIPYFRAGLENNEFCIWVVSDPLGEEEARDALRQVVPDADRYLQAGHIEIIPHTRFLSSRQRDSPADQIEIIPHTDWYLKDGAFIAERVLSGWSQKLADARARGYAGLRANGNEAWLTPENWEAFSEYEKTLDQNLAGQRMIVLCSYPLSGSSAAQIFDVVDTHQLAIVRREGKWEIVETPELRQAKSEIQRLNAELEQRVIERTKKLKETTERLRAEIEERKEVEGALRQSEERFAAFMDNLPGYAWMKDLQGRYVYVNEMVRGLPGYRSLGKTDAQIWPADLAAEYRANDQQVIAAKKPLQTLEHYQQEGKHRYMAGSKFPIFDKAGAVALVGGAGVDITERIEAEEALRASEERFRRLVEVMPVAVYVCDTSGIIQSYNHRAVELWGREPKLGDTAQRYCASLRLYSPEGKLVPHEESKMAEVLRTGVPARDLEVVIERPDGSCLTVLVNIAPLRNGAGELIGAMNCFQDITERKQAAKELEEMNHQLRFLSHRLFQIQEEERRHLARELHDEIGQTLTAAKINTEMLRAAVPPDLAARLNENATILDRLLQQTRQISLDLRPPLLDDLGLVPALRWYVNQQAERSGLEAEFSADPLADDVPPHIRIVCFRLAQEAITNVVRHADAKTLMVELRRADTFLHLIVRDDGEGFDVAAAKARAEQGASLGLLGLTERAALAGGGVHVSSSPGEGTTVEILLPVDIAESAMATQTTSERKSGGE